MAAVTFNKLHEIKPVLGKNTMYRSLRGEEVVLARLRIGLTKLTHSYLLKREDQLFCISCNEPFTVKHFLIDCIEFSHMRRQFFQRNDLTYLFMPPTSKKLEGHIASGLFVRPSVRPFVTLFDA